MHVVFSVDQTINQNKLRKTAQICEAHCCRFFRSFFYSYLDHPKKYYVYHFLSFDIHIHHFKDIKKLKLCVKEHIIW